MGKKKQSSTRYVVDVGKNQETKTLARRALKHLLDNTNDPPRLFQRSQSLIRVSEDGDGEARMELVDAKHLKSEFVEVGGFYTVTGSAKKREHKFTDLPARIDAHVLNTPALWDGVPALEGIATSPFFTKKGVLVETPGFDSETGYLLRPPDDYDMPAVSPEPTAKEMKQAVAMIKEAFHDFPFVDKASRAHAFAAMLQPFARALIWGPTPTYFFAARNPKEGKTLLARTAMFPAHGEVGMTSWPSREEEVKKHLTSIMIEAHPVVFFDNVSGNIKSDAYSALMTASNWSDRILGGSVTGRWKITQTFLMSGIAPQAKDEMVRRMVFCELDSRGVPEAKRQASFKHKGQMKWLRGERWQLAWACCTLIQAWLVAGRPEPAPATPSVASYEAWRRVLGGVLTHAGIKGLLVNAGSGIGKDEATNDLERFLNCAWDNYGSERWRVHEVIKDLYEETEPGHDSVREPFLHLTPDRDGSFARPLGRALTDGMVLGGYLVRRTSGRTGGYHAYWLERVGGES